MVYLLYVHYVTLFVYLYSRVCVRQFEVLGMFVPIVECSYLSMTDTQYYNNIYIYIYTYVYVCICICVCIYIYIYIYIYIEREREREREMCVYIYIYIYIYYNHRAERL